MGRTGFEQLIDIPKFELELNKHNPITVSLYSHKNSCQQRQKIVLMTLTMQIVDKFAIFL